MYRSPHGPDAEEFFGHVLAFFLGIVDGPLLAFFGLMDLLSGEVPMGRGSTEITLTGSGAVAAALTMMVVGLLLFACAVGHFIQHLRNARW